jgi:hypothetical protein
MMISTSPFGDSANSTLIIRMNKCMRVMEFHFFEKIDKEFNSECLKPTDISTWNILPIIHKMESGPVIADASDMTEEGGYRLQNSSPLNEAAKFDKEGSRERPSI